MSIISTAILVEDKQIMQISADVLSFLATANHVTSKNNIINRRRRLVPLDMCTNLVNKSRILNRMPKHMYFDQIGQKASQNLIPSRERRIIAYVPEVVYGSS